MAAVSCLRVMVDANRTDLPAETLGPLVAKYATIFLEVRWVRPRTADQLTHYCYLLSDPRSDVLDTVELAHLATELQERLFGTGVEDAVKLVLFEGGPEAIRAFTASTAEEVVLAMEDPGRLPTGGRLRRIAADGSLVDVPEEVRAPKGPVDDFNFGPSIDGAQGIYFPKARAFVGDVVSCTPSRAATYYSAVDGEEHLPLDSESFDGGCVMTALRFLLDFPVTTPLYVPVSFSTLVRPTQRAGYVELLGILPAETRGQLAATVYDVPRAPSFQSLKVIHEALRGHFASLDLRTQDPDFEVRQLAEKNGDERHPRASQRQPGGPDRRREAIRGARSGVQASPHLVRADQRPIPGGARTGGQPRISVPDRAGDLPAAKPAPRRPLLGSRLPAHPVDRPVAGRGRLIPLASRPAMT